MYLNLVSVELSSVYSTPAVVLVFSPPLPESSGSDNQSTWLSPHGSHGLPFQMQTTDKHNCLHLEATYITHYKGPFVLVILIL